MFLTSGFTRKFIWIPKMYSPSTSTTDSLYSLSDLFYLSTSSFYIYHHCYCYYYYYYYTMNHLLPILPLALVLWTCCCYSPILADDTTLEQQETIEVESALKGCHGEPMYCTGTIRCTTQVVLNQRHGYHFNRECSTSNLHGRGITTGNFIG